MLKKLLVGFKKRIITVGSNKHSHHDVPPACSEVLTGNQEEITKRGSRKVEAVVYSEEVSIHNFENEQKIIRAASVHWFLLLH